MPTEITLPCPTRAHQKKTGPRPAEVGKSISITVPAAVPSSAPMAPITQRFVNAIKSYAECNGIDVVSFRRGERKDERTQEYLRNWSGGEGGLYLGKAQEKARVLRTERRRHPSTGATYAWLVSSTAMVNHFYFYAVDDDFGPFFLKFCSYFPYNAKLWCARLTGEGQPVEVRRKEGVTNHFRPESCAGRCEAAGEALTGARTGRAIEHRKIRERLARRDSEPRSKATPTSPPR